MCDDFSSDYSSDVSDSSFDVSDDVSSSDFDSDFSDVSFETDDSSFDISDDFDISDGLDLVDVSDDSFDDVETLDFDDDIETLDLDDSYDDVANDFDGDYEDLDLADLSDESFDNSEGLDFDDVDADELSLDEDIDALDIDDISDEDFNIDSEIETLQLDDIDNISDDDFEIDDDIEAFESEEIVDYDLEDISANEIEENDLLTENIETIGYDNEFDEIESNDILEADIDDDIEALNSEYNFDTIDNIDEFSETEIIDATLDTNSAYESDSESIIEQSEFADNSVEEEEMTEDFENEFQESNIEEITDSDLENTLEEYEEQTTNPGDIPTYSETDDLPQMTDEELAEFVDWENAHDNAYYDMIEDIKNDSSLTDEQKDELIQPMLEELQEAENAEPEYGARVKGLTYDGRDIYTTPPEENIDEAPDYYDGNDYEFESTLTDYEEQVTNPGDIPEYSEMEEFIEDNDIEEFSGELSEQDYDTIYEGLDEYDFHGVDCLEDTERLDASLENFTAENWENLSIDEQKEQMTDLAQYIIDVTGLENPPKIEFYNNPEEGDYGGFSRATNTLSINEHMLYQNDEAADTVAHELWHAYQYERASNPRTKMDYMYLENFNDYITPSDDFEGYQSQLLESEARAFAQQIKDRLHSY